MTVMQSIPSQQYTPQTLNFNPTLPAGTTTVRITLTRESWPAGDVGSLEIDFPNGTLARKTTFQGGTFTDFRGNAVTKQSLDLQGEYDDSGVRQFLPAGQYPIKVSILQTLNTSVLVERF